MTLTYEEQQLIEREKRIKEASSDLAGIISFILMVYLSNTKLGKTVLAIALWISLVHYVDEKLRVTERGVKLFRGLKEIWN